MLFRSACGTQPGTCSDQPSIGGVAKLTSIEHWNKIAAVIKIAHDNPIKTSIPGSNRSSLVGSNGEIIDCLIHGRDADLSKCTAAYDSDDESKKLIFQHMKDVRFVSRQLIAFQDGAITREFRDTDVHRVRAHVKAERDMLHWTYKRLKNPHLMKVSLTRELFDLRKKLISNDQLMDK